MTFHQSVNFPSPRLQNSVQTNAVATKKDEIRAHRMERLPLCCVFLPEGEEISG
jgi:hypothetical protein